jgi:hypothetical protein
MDKEYVGYILAILGIALIAIGALNVAGYLSFQVVDTTPPTILYTYPANGMIYTPSDLNEIVVYAQDTSDIISATYNDKYGLKTLTVTSCAQLKHPWVLPYKFPDVNFDGKVNSIDESIFRQAFLSNRTSPNYNPNCDFNNDGFVNTQDSAILGNYFGTAVFATSITTSYSIGDKISFSFAVLDSAGNSAPFTGSFTVAEYIPLSGTWKINAKIVSDNSLVEVENGNVVVTFVCNDTTVSFSEVTAKASVKDKSYSLTYIGNNTWTRTIELSGLNTLLLEASTSSKINKISVTVKAPETPTFTIGHALMLSGGVLIVAGVIVLKKKEYEW